MLQTGSGSQPIPLWFVATPDREVTGHVEAMALYAGQGVGQVTQVVPAAQVVTELAEGLIGCCAAGAPIQGPDSAMTQRSRGRGLAGRLATPANASARVAIREPD
jgi:hypothetical protein